MKNVKFFLIGLWVFIFSVGIVSDVHAASQFSPAYDVIYEVKEPGTTLVTQKVHLTNLTTNYYATEYTLTYGTEMIDNVVAWDSSGPLATEITRGTNLTQIHVAFNDKVVGIGKTLNWTLSFTSPEIAQHLGRVWEVNLPKISQDEQAASYNVTLIVPQSFGSPAYVTPPPIQPFYWTLPESSQGITLAFGDWQGFKFDLTYHLQNPELVPGKIDIALPSDSAYQKIFLNAIVPSPSKIFTDEDGNWLASYFLLPKQNLDIKVKGQAQVSLLPRKDFPPDNKTRIYEKYLQAEKYWEQDEEIKKKAQELKTPKAIYDYVVKTLSYDYEKAAQEKTPLRLGAQAILAKPDKAICMEFTDLFIALSRAAGIPAREVDGFAYTSNSRLRPLSLVTDILHAWPEYWDDQKEIWVQIDPTWGKTSNTDYFNRFDFDHLAFAIRGSSSTTPYAAGSYKRKLSSGEGDPASKSKDGGKDVLVDFLEDLPPLSPKPPAITLNFPDKLVAGLPVKGSIKINNLNNEALYNLQINLTSSRLMPLSQVLDLSVIPPLTEETLNFRLDNPNPLAYFSNDLTAKTGQMTVSATSQILPLFLLILPLVLGFFLLTIFLGWFFKKLWTNLLKI